MNQKYLGQRIDIIKNILGKNIKYLIQIIEIRAWYQYQLREKD